LTEGGNLRLGQTPEVTDERRDKGVDEGMDCQTNIRREKLERKTEGKDIWVKEQRGSLKHG